MFIGSLSYRLQFSVSPLALAMAHARVSIKIKSQAKDGDSGGEYKYRHRCTLAILNIGPKILVPSNEELQLSVALTIQMSVRFVYSGRTLEVVSRRRFGVELMWDYRLHRISYAVFDPWLLAQRNFSFASIRIVIHIAHLFSFLVKLLVRKYKRHLFFSVVLPANLKLRLPIAVVIKRCS